MKKLISLVLSLLMLFSLAACGSADSDTEEPTVDAAAEKVAAYVEANQEKLIEPYSELFGIATGIAQLFIGDDENLVDIVALAEGREIVLSYTFQLGSDDSQTEDNLFNEVLKNSYTLFQPSQSYFDSIKEELPELEGIRIRVSDTDGILFEQSYKPQLKTDTDAQ